MNFMFSGLFWGLMLILIGLSVILKSVFHINLPIVRIIFALILIYWGVTLLSNKKSKDNDETIMFKDSSILIEEAESEKTIIFGSGKINLSDIILTDENYHLKVNVIFGSGVVYVPKDFPAIIKVSAVFGEGRLPDGSTEVFGDSVYKSPDYDRSIPHLILDLDVVFGSGVVIVR